MTGGFAFFKYMILDLFVFVVCPLLDLHLSSMDSGFAFVKYSLPAFLFKKERDLLIMCHANLGLT